MSVGSLAFDRSRPFAARQAARIAVTVHAEDPLARAGLLSHLRLDPLVDVVDEPAPSGVAVVLADRIEDLTVVRLRRLAQAQRIVLVVDQLREAELLRALDCRVAAILLRRQATPERLLSAVAAAARGERDLPGDLVGQLVDVVHRLRQQAAGSVSTGAAHPPTERELDVLRLLADGLETREIATKLAYSERTVKNVLHGWTTRFQLRNRTHAVAYALREGFL